MAVVVPNPPCLSFCGGVAARTPAPRPEADAIRIRLLYKLGFYASPSFADAARCRTNKDTVPSESDKRKPDERPPTTDREATQDAAANKLPPAARFAPIKFGGGGAAPRGRADATVGPRRRAPPAVRFDPAVAVVPIPSRRSYSPRARARLYVPPEELAAAAARNAREFVYEGWDWRSVVEEGGMYVCGASGEYVHPAHVGRGRRVNPYL